MPQMSNKDYSEYYKKKMQEQFSHKVPAIQQKLSLKPLPSNNYYKKSREKSVNKLILFILTLLFLMSFITLIIFLPKSNLSLIIIAAFGIILLFLTLTLLHKLYEKSIVKAHPALLIFIVYSLLTINMFMGTKIYTIEWAFLGFIIATVIVHDSKIDSRFLILPALLLLGYIPFLLIGKYDTLAETIAIYVYYFLVCGVVLQIIEHMRKTIINVNFDSFSKRTLKEFDWIKSSIITGVISISIIIANRFYDLPLLKWTSVYLFLVCLIIYLLSTLKEEN